MKTQQEATKNSAGLIIAITCLLSIGYAILRYHIVGTVPWKDFPFFIFNKGISLAAFILLSFNFSVGPLNNIGIKVSEGWLNARKALGMTGFLLVLIHALISFMLFKPEIFAKFFEENGSLTLFAGLSMLGGILSFVVLWAYNLSFQTHMIEDKAFIKFITSRKFLLISMLLSLVHLFFMGYEGWLNPSAWNGGLPPISLIAFTFFVVAYIINLFGRK
jgi:DMSO/TMAO reductase YedYZ heme-binding membrane subunit